MWRDIKKVISEKDNFLITTHVNPDGDGIGGATALLELLTLMGKKGRIVCDSPIPKKFHFLNTHRTCEEYDPKKRYEDVEAVIVLDTHSKDRIGRITEIIKRDKVTTICIDHHIATETLAEYNAINPKSCSVGAMIYTLYKECGYDLNIEAAKGIYASIMCDTGRFSYSSTSRKAHKIADECIKVGVDPDMMYSKLYQQVSLQQFQIFAKAIQRMEVYFDNHLVVQTILLSDIEPFYDPKVDIFQIDLEYIHEFNKLIEDVECVILFYELPNDEVRVSCRSKRDLDIEKVMRSFGGGGHLKAAGANVKGSVKEVKERVLKSIEKEIQR